jgi:hypothetical protein
MLAVSDGKVAIDFYKAAFGTELLWNLDGGHAVAGLSIGGAKFFLAHESLLTARGCQPPWDYSAEFADHGKCSPAIRQPGIGTLQRAQEVQDVLHLRWVEPMEVTQNSVCFRATVRVTEAIVVIVMITTRAFVFTVGMTFYRLKQV